MSKTTTTEQASGFFDELIQSQDKPHDRTSIEEGLSELDNEVSDSSEAVDDSTDKPGRLVPEARRALVRLMRLGVITTRNQAGLFNSLCRYQAEIRDHLADMYLRMTLDQRAGIAILQELADIEEEDEPVSLINRRTLSLYDSLLLLVLRKYYQERESAGAQQIFIDYENIEALLTPFLPLTNSSRGDKRNLSGALEKLKEKKIISGSKDAERYEIIPVIRYVVNADFLKEMLDRYQEMAGQAQQQVESHDGN